MRIRTFILSSGNINQMWRKDLTVLIFVVSLQSYLLQHAIIKSTFPPESQIPTLKIKKAFVTYFVAIQMTVTTIMRMPRHTTATATDNRTRIVLSSDSGIKYKESFTGISSSLINLMKTCIGQSKYRAVSPCTNESLWLSFLFLCMFIQNFFIALSLGLEDL